MPELTEKQKELRIIRFRKIIKYRGLFGWLFSFVGTALIVVGIDNGFAPLVTLNGFIFFGYGLFMVWQAKNELKKLRRSRRVP